MDSYFSNSYLNLFHEEMLCVYFFSKIPRFCIIFARFDMIVILDYGVGNIKSIHNMFRKIGVESIISSNVEDIMRSTKLVLPGVGAFDHGMNSLIQSGLYDVLQEEVLVKRKPILGICLGMQLMTKGSEEGNSEGLGWIQAETKKFVNINLPIPHMGWNEIQLAKSESPLFDNMPTNSRFYFVHSYFVDCVNSGDVSALADYGGLFTCSFQHQNIFGVQFHPEKSHKFGMQLLSNFNKI